jgi:hypothetical protein
MLYLLTAYGTAVASLPVFRCIQVFIVRFVGALCRPSLREDGLLELFPCFSMIAERSATCFSLPNIKKRR